MCMNLLASVVLRLSRAVSHISRRHTTTHNLSIIYTTTLALLGAFYFSLQIVVVEVASWFMGHR